VPLLCLGGSNDKEKKKHKYINEGAHSSDQCAVRILSFLLFLMGGGGRRGSFNRHALNGVWEGARCHRRRRLPA
jgi:hypothetical protein